MAGFLSEIFDYGSQCIAVTFFARTEKQIGIPRLVCPLLYITRQQKISSSQFQRSIDSSVVNNPRVSH